jgi:hypothetical protein
MSTEAETKTCSSSSGSQHAPRAPHEEILMHAKRLDQRLASL